MTDFPIDQTAMLGGLRFHYREWPNPGAQALVLLHGFTGHARSWESFALARRVGNRGMANWALSFAAIANLVAASEWRHAVDALHESRMRTGMRVRPRWRDETRGEIGDIACFEPEA